jgi:photosystem II stability/assembly factor-like uncharacterized protein
MITVFFKRIICAAMPVLALMAADAWAADFSYVTAAQSLHWRLVGPHRGGRTRAVTGVPGQLDTFYIGAVNGGVWKTTDAGRTWNPLFDSAPTQSIGAIAVAASNPSIIYVASGEGLMRPDLSVGDGVYRSDDGGANWTHRGLDDSQQIPELVVDPKDPDRLFAAVLGHPFGPSAERGIFGSIDGGKTWNRLLHVSDDTGASFVRMDPQDSNVLYAGLWNVRAGPWEDDNVFNGTAGGLYKSIDGGAHWQRLGDGLPPNLSQIDVAIAPSDPKRLYATVATNEEGGYDSAAGLGVFRSDDAGEHWRRITTDPRPALRIGGGDLALLKVDPKDPDTLYSASIVVQKSTDGGVHWSSLRGSPGGDDYQNIWISPDDPHRIAIVADQGAIITVNGGLTWSSWLNQPTAQLYHLGISNTYPYKICSGQQESGSVCISSRGNDGEITLREWHPVGVIEYGYAVPDPVDPDIIYGSGRNVVTRTHLSTGQTQDITPIPIKGENDRFDRTEPLFFSPQDPHHMYYAANRLYETVDAGRHWQAVSPDLTRESPGVPDSVGKMYVEKAAKQRGAIYAASPSPLRAGIIWLGTDDGLVWISEDAGKSWQNITPPALTPWSKVTQIEASHFDAMTAYVAVSRFRIDDSKPYLYRTRDGGKSWNLIVGGLPPDAAVNSVREDTVRRGLLFAATEKSVWMSDDDGEHWQPLQLNLPHTSMRDLAIHDQDLVLATHGRSFWVLDDIAPLRQFNAKMAAGEAALVNPAAAVRAKRSTGSDTAIQPDEPTGFNPPDGALIDYYLAKDQKGPVSLEVRDTNGTVVRRVASTDAPEYDADQMQREIIPQYWIKQTPAPSAKAGMHRWVWDLHYAPPRSVKRGYPISAVPHETPSEPRGPAAVPGAYQVVLRAGSREWRAPLTVMPDPRVSATAADFEAQFTAARELAGVLDESTEALQRAQSLRDQIKKLLEKPATLADKLHEMDGHLAVLLKPDGAQSQARGLEQLNGDAVILYGQVEAADAAPTAVQMSETDRAISDWQALAPRWHDLQNEVKATNLALGKAKLPKLAPEKPVPRDLNFADED